MSTLLHEYPDHHVEIEQESYAHLAAHITQIAFPVVHPVDRPFSVLERVR